MWYELGKSITSKVSVFLLKSLVGVSNETGAHLVERKRLDVKDAEPTAPIHEDLEKADVASKWIQH